MECLQKEIVILESQIDELRLEKQNGFRELTCVRNGLQEQIRSLQMKLEDQTDQRGKADQVICHLREEVSQLSPVIPSSMFICFSLLTISRSIPLKQLLEVYVGNSSNNSLTRERHTFTGRR